MGSGQELSHYLRTWKSLVPLPTWETLFPVNWVLIFVSWKLGTDSLGAILQPVRLTCFCPSVPGPHGCPVSAGNHLGHYTRLLAGCCTSCHHHSLTEQNHEKGAFSICKQTHCHHQIKQAWHVSQSVLKKYINDWQYLITSGLPVPSGAL